MFIRSTALALLLAGCAHYSRQLAIGSAGEPTKVELFDADRKRPIPLVIYGETKGETKGETAKPLAIISHGYGGHNTAYSFLASALVRQGYLVASIEHLERPGDPPMANDGNLAERRRPVWQIGADSIGYVIRELRRERLARGDVGVVVIGHSNGGDMTMLFASEHPETVRVALSLDNRRMPVPRTTMPRICSMRSSDFAADPGVLPPPGEQKTLGMVITTVPVKHNDMWDGASAPQKQAMLAVLSSCLKAPL